MIKPDYYGNSILNLTSTLINGMGGRTPVPPLRDIDPRRVAGARHVLLLVIDGLGTRFLQRHAPDSFLSDEMIREITSVFPTTTAAALTTLATGTPPRRHACTGWFVWLRELGCASVILPFAPRYEWRSFDQAGVKAGEVFDFPNRYTTITPERHIVIPRAIVGTTFSEYSAAGAIVHGYRTLTGLGNHLSKITSYQHKTFSYVYWPTFDKLAHQKGINSRECIEHFSELDRFIHQLTRRLSGSNTLLVITADHGLIDTDPGHHIDIGDIPGLCDCLNIPLCGEPRVPYCYLKPERVRQFEQIVAEHLDDFCDMFTREEIKDLYGPDASDESPRFEDRIGDRILLMKEDFILTENVLGEKGHNFIGYHAALTADEVHVPLVMLSL